MLPVVVHEAALAATTDGLGATDGLAGWLWLELAVGVELGVPIEGRLGLAR
jgi:hypothetical protein